MMHHDFDPWAEIERLRLRAAKAAKPAQAAQDFSRISNFSQGAVRRCRRCQDLESRGIAVLLCVGCGYVARPERQRGVLDSFHARSGPESLSKVEEPTQGVAHD